MVEVLDREDKLFARRLHDTLQGRGIRCWLDEKQMLPGGAGGPWHPFVGQGAAVLLPAFAGELVGG
jgi:hypothetical protein